MYDELIKRLREAPDDWPDAELHYQAADAIEELSSSKWISVNERLPVKEGEYITFTNASGKSKGVLAQNFEITTVRGKEVKRWIWFNRISPWKVTHWMPMPEPPKEET